MHRYGYRDDDRWRGRRDWDDDQDRVFGRGYPTDRYGGYRGAGSTWHIGPRHESEYGASWNREYDRGWDWHGRGDWDRGRWDSRDRDVASRPGMGERIRRGWDRFTDRMNDFGDRGAGYGRDRGWEPRDRHVGRDRAPYSDDRDMRWERDPGYDRGYDFDADYDRASYSARDYGYDREPRYGRGRDDYGHEREWSSPSRRGGRGRGDW